MAYGDRILFGSLPYGGSVEAGGGEETFTPDLLRYLPEYYRMPEGTMAVLQKTAASEVGKLLYRMDDLENQLFIGTATWGLNRWEEELGLTTDASKPEARRRKQILAKRQGSGTVTPQMLRETAEAFSGGEAAVIEYQEEYRFVVHFIGFLGIPPNLADFKTLLQQLTPAHIRFDFAYSYVTWAVLRKYGLTWAQVKAMTWYQLRTYGGE